MSDREFRSKTRRKAKHTRARARRKEKTREIVRLLGGDGEEEFALKHAEELVRQAKQYKEAIN
ncbi:MAG: hypothetical protein ACLS4Z_09850 [Christensenellaceae bacterium]